MEKLLFNNPSQCCGCGTCAIACPVGAIEMAQKELGSLYPRINAELCIECQRCVTSCAYQLEEALGNTPQKAYAAAADDKELLKRSASGGAFAALASAVLDDGGAVFGCSLESVDEKLTPMHICVETIDALAKLQGSKYVQSELGDTFIRIIQILMQGRTVLFSGTPCQVAALKLFTRGLNCEKLYTIDLICHGVPSAKLFQDYLEQLCNHKIVDFRFRDKTNGWGLNAKFSYIDEHGEKKQQRMSSGLSSYYSYFLASETYRSSCYSCRYAGKGRTGDITVGDYWGIENEHPEFISANGGVLLPKAGVSAILVNTPKGKDMVERFGKNLVCLESQVQKAANGNRQLNAPSRHSPVRDDIIAAYDQNGYEGIEKMFRKQLGLQYHVRKLKVYIKTLIKY